MSHPWRALYGHIEAREGRRARAASIPRISPAVQRLGVMGDAPTYVQAVQL